MERISIGRLSSHPEALGVVEPESKLWQLVIDKDGLPHLYVAVDIGDDKTGLLCVEDCMHSSIRQLMTTPTKEASEEDTRLGLAEFEQSRRDNPIPCPVVS